MPQPIDRCVVVTRKTQLEELLLRYNTKEQAQFMLRAPEDDFSGLAKRHDTYVNAVDALKRSLPQGLKLAVIDRMFLPQFEFLDDVVIAIGQDGLVSNTAKYLSGQPLVGINPDPDFIEGVLLPWQVGQIGKLLPHILSGSHAVQYVTLAEATLNDGRILRAFNDLFIGQAGHASALYEIVFEGQREFQSSSGIIVSTGAGSTGWMRSVYTGSRALASQDTDMLSNPVVPFARETETLTFAVREPWPSRKTGTKIVSGMIATDQPLVVQSRMAANGVIFSDGIEWDFLEFNSGNHATISIASEKAVLVVP